jgi:hypothetical protein
MHIWRCIFPIGPYLFQDVMISLLTPTFGDIIYVPRVGVFPVDAIVLL